MRKRTIIHNGGRAMKLDLPRQDLLDFWSTKVSDMTVISAMLYFIGINEGWKNMLELGSGEGLTCQAMDEVASKTGGKILTVDIERNTSAKIPHTPRVHQLLASTHDVPKVISKLEELDLMSLDMLWIDADHRKEAVAQDFENYNHLVRPEGMILFHDVCVLDPECEVPEWWIDKEFPGFEKLTLSFNNGLGMLRKIS